MNKQEQYDYFCKSFTNIKSENEQINRIEVIRNEYKLLLKKILDNCIQSRELSIALSNLENSLMYAVKSIVLEDNRENDYIYRPDIIEVLDELSTKVFRKVKLEKDTLYICSTENGEYHINEETKILYIHKFPGNKLRHDSIQLTDKDYNMILNRTLLGVEK